MIRKLRIKFVCTNMAIVLVMLCAILATVLAFTQNNLEKSAVSFMQEMAADPLQLVRPGETAMGFQLPFFSVEIGAGGQVVVANGGHYDLEDAETLQEITALSLADAEKSGILRDYNLRYYRMVTPTSQRIVFADVSSEVSTMNHMFRYCLAIGGASLLVFFFISLALSYWAIAPVDMAWKQQKRFVSDASHELKTPLSLISLNAELLEEGSAAGGEGDREPLRNILVGVERMRELVESLLELARADNGLPRKQMLPVDLSRLVSCTALSTEALFVERGQRLEVQTEPGISVRGSARHLEELLSILLDNAHKYGAAEGEVRVTLERCGAGRCQLCVRSSGEPIPREKLKRIFDRFYRLDEARVANGSYGLGLSIAEAIVREHGGKIWAASGEGQNSFFVRLPLRKTARGKSAQKISP